MKLLSGNGRTFTVRNAGPVVFELRARPGGTPIKFNAARVVEDDEARAICRELLDIGLYERVT